MLAFAKIKIKNDCLVTKKFAVYIICISAQSFSSYLWSTILCYCFTMFIYSFVCLTITIYYTFSVFTSFSICIPIHYDFLTKQTVYAFLLASSDLHNSELYCCFFHQEGQISSMYTLTMALSFSIFSIIVIISVYESLALVALHVYWDFSFSLIYDREYAVGLCDFLVFNHIKCDYI